MKVETLELLQKLQKKYGIGGTPSGPFGKIAQKLMALSLHEMGFRDIVERGVQGVDVDATSESGEKLACEVKTTEKLTVPLTSDNARALRERVRDGYQPVIAVLRLAPLENWVLAKVPANEIPTGELLIEGLRRHRMTDMEDRLAPKFDLVVQKHFKGVWGGGEQYLKKRLREAGVAARET